MATPRANARANVHRGENSITLAGSVFVLRPDFEAVAAIDEELGSVIALTRRAIAEPASLQLQELAVVVAEGIKAHGRAVHDSNAHVSTDKIKRMIYDTGIPTVVPAVLRFLSAAITGGAKEPPLGKA